MLGRFERRSRNAKTETQEPDRVPVAGCRPVWLPFCGKVQTKSNPVEDGRANIDYGCARHLVTLVEQILGSGKYFEVPCEGATHLQVHGVEAIQRKLVLVVIELLAHETSLQAEQKPRRIPVASFPGEDIARDLRYLQAYQRD